MASGAAGRLTNLLAGTPSDQNATLTEGVHGLSAHAEDRKAIGVRSKRRLIGLPPLPSFARWFNALAEDRQAERVMAGMALRSEASKVAYELTVEQICPKGDQAL